MLYVLYLLCVCVLVVIFWFSSCFFYRIYLAFRRIVCCSYRVFEGFGSSCHKNNFVDWKCCVLLLKQIKNIPNKKMRTNYNPKLSPTLSEALHKYGEIIDSMGVKRSTVQCIKLLKSFVRMEALGRLAALGFFVDDKINLN